MQNLIDLEKRGWTALSTGKREAADFYGALLIDDAIVVFPGAVMLVGKGEILEAMDAQPWDSRTLAVGFPPADAGLVFMRKPWRKAR